MGAFQHLDESEGAPDSAAGTSDGGGERRRRRRRRKQKNKNRIRKRRQLYQTIGWLAAGMALGLPVLAAFFYLLSRF